jgi:hypothetical protein
VCSCGVFDAVDDSQIEIGAGGLVVFGGVVALGFEDGPELDGGGEEAAAFADGLEGALKLCGPGAPSDEPAPRVSGSRVRR